MYFILSSSPSFLAVYIDKNFESVTYKTFEEKVTLRDKSKITVKT